MALNTIATIRRHLRLETGNDQFTDAEITSFLDDANSMLFEEIRRKYEVFRQRVGYNQYDGAVRRIFSIPQKPVDSILKVLKNNEEITSGNYTHDTDLDQITIDSSVDLEGFDQLEIYFVPKIYTTAERYICLYIMGIAENLVTAEGSAALGDKFKPLMEKTIHKINTRMRASAL